MLENRKALMSEQLDSVFDVALCTQDQGELSLGLCDLERITDLFKKG
ncbi:hypothetical protein ENSA5_06280 [Enhygromyxa salina]|uniref:Uncharacterized protein n=1 Tax=Enhygromyxa salina TaxID=215803 RepID=A0A2S9YHN9_9BACT|nr:hypothetical protein ENSA5_06280 [Enhygromyxa salina]